MAGIRAWNPVDFKTKTLSVRIKPDLWERLQVVAAAEKARSPSHFVRQLVVNACPTLTPPAPPTSSKGKRRPARAGQKIRPRRPSPGKKGSRSRPRKIHRKR